MSQSARLFITFIFIIIFCLLSFFGTTGFCSDSLKVGLLFKPIDRSERDSLSYQFIKALCEKSKLQIVPIDTNNSIAVEPFVIDSTTVKELKIQGLILCKLAMSDSVHRLTIEALAFENLKQKKFAEIAIDQKDTSGRLLAVVRELEIFFLPQQQSINTLRIIFSPGIHSKTDSSLLTFQRGLFDGLKKLSNIPQFSKIEFEFLANESIKHADWTDSTIEKISKSYHAHLIMSGKIDQDEKQKLFYHPHLITLKQNTTQNSIYTDDKVLSGTTCQIRQFDFPVISLENLSNLINFIKGYFLIQSKQYADAIEHLKNLHSFPGYYYLAESYFYHGVEMEHDPSLAQANWDSSIFYWKKSLSQADSDWNCICSNNNIGVAFQLNGKIDSAAVYFARANSDRTEHPDNNDYIQISHNLGNIFLINGQWKKALDIFQSTVTTMEHLSDSLNLAITYENLGHIYQLIYQRNKAISYYQKALSLRQKMHDEAAIANSLNLIGNAYQGNKDYQLATDCFKQSLALNLKIHHEPQLASVYDNLGQVFQDMGELDSALIYFQKSLETFDLLGDKDSAIETLVHQASVYQKQRVADKAIALYEKALEMIGDNNSRSLKAQIYDRLGSIYNNQNNLIPALDYFKQAADLYEPAGNFETLSLVLYSMGLIKLKQNDYAEGYQLLKKAITLDEERGFNNLSGEKYFLDQVEGILKKN